MPLMPGPFHGEPSNVANVSTAAAPQSQRVTEVAPSPGSEMTDADAPKPGPACLAAHRYDNLVKTRRYGEIAALFATNAEWFMPTGVITRGREAIGRAFQAYLGDRQPIFRTDNYVDGGLTCVMEVSMMVRVDPQGKVVLGPDGSAMIIPNGSSEKGVFVRRAIDHFTVDAEGLITRMIVYNAPTTYWR